MRAFQSEGRTINAYLAEPEHRSGAGVLVLHAWWGLTQPFRQICDPLAEAGFVALAPDLYHGKTTTAIEEAEALVDALNQEKERVRNVLEQCRFCSNTLRHLQRVGGAGQARRRRLLAGRCLRARPVCQGGRRDRRSCDLLLRLLRTRI